MHTITVTLRDREDGTVSMESSFDPPADDKKITQAGMAWALMMEALQEGTEEILSDT